VPLRNARAVNFRPQGLSDTADSTTAFAGAMATTKNLIPSTHTRNLWVPRPASFLYIDFGRSDAIGEQLLVVGSKIYGLVTSARHPGFSEPFAYDLTKGKFLPIVGAVPQFLPLSAPATGDWQPPSATPVGAYILFAHTGFLLPNAFGWLDMTGFTDSATGTTGGAVFVPTRWGEELWGLSLWSGFFTGGGHVVGLDKNVLQAGWRPGMLVSDSGFSIVPGTRIAAVAEDGLSITLTQATAGSVVGETIFVTGGTPEAPLWAAGNTSIFPLPDVAAAIGNFNARAYFGVGTATPFSDAGDPLLRSEAKNVLTYDNGFPVTAFATIPMVTQLGGVAQSLLAFQGDAAIQQIKGDPATNDLSKNLLATIGTLAPNALTPLPIGVGFIAPDGARIIGQDGTVSDPIGVDGDGVAIPFVNVVYPTRMASAYNEDVWRISVTYHADDQGVPSAEILSGEFWYHIKLKVWSGPHSFPSRLIAPVDYGTAFHGYLLFPLNTDSGLWFSNSRPVVNSGYIENQERMTWEFATSLIPDSGLMFMNAVNETTIMLSMPPAEVIQVSAVNEGGELIDAVTLKGAAPPVARWGMALWGVGRWAGAALAPGRIAGWGQSKWGVGIWGDENLFGTESIKGTVISQRLIPWSRELVFKQGRLVMAGRSSPQMALGSVYMRYQQTGYTITDISGVSS
jgi:hypothetical protein